MSTPQASRRLNLSRWLLPAALLTTGVYSWACADTSNSLSADDDTDGNPGKADGQDSSDPIDPASVTRADVLHRVADHVIAPATAEFSDRATALSEAVDVYLVAANADPLGAGTERAAAQDAWRSAMESWQRLEVMKVGPAGELGSHPGGESLRREIYSWPIASSCLIDRRTEQRRYLQPTFFQAELESAYGLDALEYLLFKSTGGHTCASSFGDVWDEMTTFEIIRRRAEYAAVAAQGVADNATTLAERWSHDGDDFGSDLANPGPSSTYANEQEAIDAVFRAMFYVDQLTKSRKLGSPIGTEQGCSTPPCSQFFEHGSSGMSHTAVVANLEGFKLLLQGGENPEAVAGFDDLLVAAGQPELAAEMIAELDAAIEAARALPSSLQEQAESDLDPLVELHASIKNVTDILKGPFVMSLMLNIPIEGSGDAD